MTYDFIVIGAGIAGASAAYELAANGTVLLIEAEAQPGYHSTGRSAALFTRNYGTSLVRAINALSEPFFSDPPEDFASEPLLQPRGALAVANAKDANLLDQVLMASTQANPIIEMTPKDALAMAPFLREDQVARAVYEAGVMDIDVALLLQSYLKAFRKRGGTVQTRHPVMSMTHAQGCWSVTTKIQTFQGRTVVNAAGAWADQVGALARAKPIGLVAKRRTAIILDATTGYDVARLPCVDFTGDDAYIKPDAGKLMASPGDATPMEPQDAQPDEMDIAVLADWIQRHTLLPVRRIEHSWAGLRSFVADGGPVIGFDDVLPNFIWNAGQGGYGIMMAPSLAKAVASLCHDQTLPDDFVASGLAVTDLSRTRLDLSDNT
ncbi:NAD(P)/FAD-dependent oxidoreductase [Parasulfitobacter algicola]|uniref:FAD-binding oxidoreductase n=1 Tax=Parasulfitobacter algicola TaxID=2614809 RepID=A0ABX2ITS7_9RHOB|nr:FAD-binding oxidoreductase [Sulfitobacter algicola]NSX53769.1 FAD-binding oxidoreductase [Sulfitobacter algicola]